MSAYAIGVLVACAWLAFAVANGALAGILYHDPFVRQTYVMGGCLIGPVMTLYLVVTLLSEHVSRRIERRALVTKREAKIEEEAHAAILDDIRSGPWNDQ